MKNVLLGAWLCSVIICFSSCKSSQQGKGWRLVWEENFNRKGVIDTASWSKIPRGGNADWMKYMSDNDLCYDVTDGNLILKGLVNPDKTTDTATYITGGIYTKDKVNFTYGKIEVKAKLQGAKGAWPAIWMLPQHTGWPLGGEIDIMERLNNNNIVYQTVHSNYTFNLGITNNPKHGSTGPINKDDYNVYAVEIYPDSLVFSINGNHTLTYPKIKTDKEGQYPFGEPFYLLIDMQLEGSWVGKADPADLPVEMKVDWVRYSQKK